MAVIKTGEHISKIAGAQGDHVYSSWRGKQYLRSKSSSRSNPVSSRQASARAGVTALSKTWFDTLDDSLRALWDEIAQRYKLPVDPASSREQGSRVVIPQPKTVLSGYDAFIRANQRAIMTGITPIGSPILAPSSVYPNPVTSLERIVTPPTPVVFSLDFDGVNEDVILGNVLGYDYNQPQSWEFWMNADTLIDWFYLIIKRPLPNLAGYQITWIGNTLTWGIMRIPGAEDIGVSRAFTTTGVFKHIIMTYDGSNTAAGMNVYVDSVIGSIITINLPINFSIVTAAPLTFASWQQQALSWFDGKLDCIRNYNRNLIQADVTTLFNEGAGLYGADPLSDGSCQGSWPVCTGAGNTLFDISGNNYHGTLRNMEPGDWVLGKVPCPDIPGVDQIQWIPPTVEAGSKIRIWIVSYDAGVHKQHVATIDAGVGFWIPGNCRVAKGHEVPIASMPGHYLIQADVISPSGNQSPPSNTLETTFP